MRFVLMTLALVAGGSFQPTGGQDIERAAIKQAVLDYAEGYYDHAPERMERAISPLLTKRALMARPGVAPFLLQMNAEMLLEATRGAAPRPAPAERRLVAEVLDVTGDIASARVFSVEFNDYVHLIRRDRRWTLVNVLWHPPPPSAHPAEAITPAIVQAARDYAGLAAGAPERVAAVVSPVAVMRTLITAPSGARVVREQNAESMAAAIASGQMPKRVDTPPVTVLGADGDIASVKIGDGPATTYLHLALQNGRWLVVNTLNAAGQR
jgi:hypothetical protein